MDQHNSSFPSARVHIAMHAGLGRRTQDQPGPHPARESGSGAAFGATLFCTFVLSSARRCGVDNESISFNMRILFCTVLFGARRCSVAQIRT